VKKNAVGNAQHSDTSTAEERVARSVLPFSIDVRVAVELNGKARCRAEEVGEVGTDGKLAAEAKTVDLPASK